MTVHGLRLFLALALTLVLPASGTVRADETPRCGGSPVPARIMEAVDGSSLKLEDGRVVRLANVIAPQPIDGDAQAVLRAKEALAEIANGKEALLFLVNENRDRYGRLSAAAVLIGGRAWLEAGLLTRGIVQVLPSANDKCITALLQHEVKARIARHGLWSDPKFGVFDASQPEALLAAVGRFVVAEGVIRRVGESRGRIYLDFGRRFTEDFTIIVPDSVRRSLVSQGSDPKSWRGKRIRVRGIVFSWGGPAIEASIVQAIELLD